MNPILPAMSKEDFDSAMHYGLEGKLLCATSGWSMDVKSAVESDTVSSPGHFIVRLTTTITAAKSCSSDEMRGSFVLPMGDLPTGKSLALSVLFDNKPAHALADFMQEEGLVPVPRETVADIVDKLVLFARRKRMDAANGKFRGVVMDNTAWTAVEGMLSEVARRLDAGDDVDDWK